ncbi:unnamed protein product, partial [Ectocarpus sp. 8 AP-2014]
MPPFLNSSTRRIHPHVMRPASCAPVHAREGPRYVSGRRVELLVQSMKRCFFAIWIPTCCTCDICVSTSLFSVSRASLFTMTSASTNCGNWRTTTTPAYRCFLMVIGGGTMNIFTNFGLSRGCMTKRGHF